VSYRGVEVGRIEAVRLTPDGVDTVLSLNSDTRIPADLIAEVHSQTAIGEQYVDLVPGADTGRLLRDGDVIPADRTTTPPDINTILTATNKGLQAVPHDDLKTAIDESYTAVGGLGPELERIVTGATKLASDAHKNLGAVTTLIDQSNPILDSQIDSSDSIQAWAANTARITQQLKSQDPALRGILDTGPQATDEARALIQRLQPTLPTLLSNLVGIEQVAVTYNPSLEQILVLLPQDVAMLQAARRTPRSPGRRSAASRR
jgi:phospholipid/cholesterol/gamma-HCH transport system substrate-binding protein